MSATILQLPYGNGHIEFQLARRDRKTLSISVHPNLGVEVIAPVDAPVEKIFDKVRKRAPWIRKQIQFFSQFQPRTPERQFLAGETHFYLGRQYRLKVVHDVQQEVKLYRGRILVQSHKPKDRAQTRELVEGWYRERAHIKFRERLALCQQRFSRPEAYEPAGLVVRQLKQRWGSMTPDRNLVLNRSLIRSSVDAIDYVITHELCHISHDHHGAEFYKLLDRVMPDWEKRKVKLERQMA
jgi:predicted metal-dependent hydrolase